MCIRDRAYVMDEIFDKMIGGEAAIGVYYSGDAITMIDDNSHASADGGRYA